MAWPIPSRIDTGRLVLRRYELADAPPVHAVIAESLEHLLPFIPWAPQEPLSVIERDAQMAEYGRAFDAGEAFRLAMIDAATGGLIGGVALLPRVGPDALELGYWITPGRQGEGLVAEAVVALTEVARHAGAARAEIWCHQDNVRSQAVAQRCGFSPVGTRPRGDLELAVWELHL